MNGSQTRVYCRQGPRIHRFQSACQARRGYQGGQEDLKDRCTRRGRKEEEKEDAQGDVLFLHLQG